MKKKLSLFFSVMLLSICAHSQVYSSTVFSRSGHPIGGAGLCLSSTDPGTTTTACGAGTIVSTFTDQTGGTQCVGTGTLTSGTGCSNPGISDGNGNYSFFKPTSGIYWVQVYGNGINTAVTPIVIPTTASNFVDLPSAQTITGLKTFANSIKFSPVAAPTCLAGFGFIWYDSGANGMRLCNNGGTVVDISPPFSDALNLIKGNADATKLLRINVSGNTAGILGTFNTAFTTAKTLTFPDATDTLSGKATTDIYTNKTYDTAGTGNVFKINSTVINAITGNTSKVVTSTGSLITSNCGSWDANGNAVDGGSRCDGITIVTSPYTNASTTFSDVTNMSWPIVASRNYSLTCHIMWQGSANTAGPKFQITGPASPTNTMITLISAVTATTSIYAGAGGASFSNPVANSGAVTTVTNFPATVAAGIINGANAGTLKLQAAANGAGTLTIQSGSNCVIQ